MFSPIARILRLTQIAALLILGGSAAVLYSYLGHLEWAERQVSHTHEVISEIERARLAALRSGVWMRNYVVSPSPDVFARVRSLAAEASDAVQRVAKLTEGHPEQHRNAQELVREMDDLLAAYATAAELGERDDLLGAYLMAADLGERERPLALDRQWLAQDKAVHTHRVHERLEAMEKVERESLRTWSMTERQQLLRVKQLLLSLGVAVAAVILWSMRYSARLLRLRQQAVAQLESHAASDPLTGVLNRREFHHQLGRLAQRLIQKQTQAAVLVFDLDDFKPVNDRYGHAAGDEVLKVVTERVRQQCREGDLVARLGGDEFVVALGSVSSREAARAAANRILSHLREPIDVGAAKVRIGASIGIAMVPEDGDAPENLLQVADAGLYRAKRAGKGSVAFGLPEPA